MDKLKVINLFGAPCSGKSTLAMRLAADMKVKGYNVEYVPEYAKRLTHEQNICRLSDQILIFGEQQHMLIELEGKADWIVTDSPFPMGLTYLTKPKKPLNDLVWYEFHETYQNFNFYLPSKYEYQTTGRNQDEEGALKKGQEIKKLLNDNNIVYNVIEETKLKKRVKEVLRNL